MSGNETKNGNEFQPNIEIERKFLVNYLPDELENGTEIIQGYFRTEDGSEMRIRRKGDKYLQTKKVGSGLEREEDEIEISKEEFDRRWPETTGRISKTRYEIPLPGALLELDIYHGDLEGQKIAEVELKTADEALDLSVLPWVGEDVTGRSEYSNYELAHNGWPEAQKSVPEYEKEQGLKIAISLIREKMQTQSEPLIVQIAGGSASGKTSEVAKKIQAAFADDAVIVSMDDYYRGVPFMEAEAAKGNILTWDEPAAVDIDLHRQQLNELKNGQTINKPIYDFVSGSRTGFEPLAPKRVIIVEGLFALNDQLAPEGDIKIFVEIGLHGRILRRIMRDVVERGKMPEDVLEVFAEIVEPMHERHVEPTKNNADLIIRNEYQPLVEADRASGHENQLKFKADLTEADIIHAGGRLISEAEQTDAYYNPFDRDLSQTGEVLRVRQQAGEYFLAYKGPKKMAETRVRPMFEYKIQPQVAEKFLNIYGQMVKIINKKRALFVLDGVEIALDNVTKIENNQQTDLKTFVEIRADDKMMKDSLPEVIKKLNLKMVEATSKSYVEM